MFRSGLLAASTTRMMTRSSPLAGRMIVRAASTTATQQRQTNQSTTSSPAPSTIYKIYHYSSYSLLALMPLGWALAPAYSMPIDLVLNVIIPVHTYLGMEAIIGDYIYAPAARYSAKAALAVVTVLMTLGLYKLNTKDVGISQSVKLLWKDTTTHSARK
eukprot:TRINITY_DN814_c0_g1_i1.p1 TRINITY_DN814_c0_g1~~TRINITY_DN814_c0_g1_i1.p1  ORF type:complete len:159 (-),score=40.21 TRINITY_DN814_c0_g1_i1:42-518(-)